MADPDKAPIIHSLSVERENLADIWTHKFQVDKITIIAIDYEAIQEDDRTRRSQFDKFVMDLSLAVAEIEFQLEQPQALGDGAQGGSAAGHHTFEKLKFPKFETIQINIDIEVATDTR